MFDMRYVFHGEKPSQLSSIQRPPLLSGRSHLFAVASVLFIWFFTYIKRPANYLSKGNGDRGYKVITDNNKKTRTAI